MDHRLRPGTSRIFYLAGDVDGASVLEADCWIQTLKMSLAGSCKVSAKTTKRWSVEFNWQERIQQRDIENGRKILQDELGEPVAIHKVKYIMGIL